MRALAAPFLIIWSMIWRATLLAPVCFVFQVFAIASWLGRYFLPVLVGIAALSGDWVFFFVYLFLSVFSFALWRWKPFLKLMELPPSLL